MEIPKTPSKPESLFKDWEVGPRYTLRKLIGEGSFGKVALAYDNTVMRRVAIKKVPINFGCSNECKRVLREMMLLRRMDHPCTTSIYDIIIPGDEKTFTEIYFVMSFSETDMNDILYSDMTLTQEQANGITYDVISAMKYLKSANVIHRDIKPGNILINMNGTAKLCDFGLGRSLPKKTPMRSSKQSSLSDSQSNIQSSAQNTSPSEKDEERLARGRRSRSQENSQKEKAKRCLSAHVATRWYRAPELILLQEEYDEKVDMWSLGCVYGELLGMLEGANTGPNERYPLFPGDSCFPLTKEEEEEHNEKPKERGPKDQLNLVFSVIGTPANKASEFITNTSALNYLHSLPAHKGIDFEQKFPHASKESVDFLKKCLEFDPKNRMSIDEALAHPIFSEFRNPELEAFTMEKADWSWEESSSQMTPVQFRSLMVKEKDEFIEELESKYYF